MPNSDGNIEVTFLTMDASLILKTDLSLSVTLRPTKGVRRLVHFYVAGCKPERKSPQCWWKYGVIQCHVTAILRADNIIPNSNISFVKRMLTVYPSYDGILLAHEASCV